MASSRRDHLVEVAQKLFYQNGFRATGIDLILSESGVAKKTLYNHFQSKDELIIATLERRDRQFMSNLRDGVGRHLSKQTGDLRLAKILALFDTIEEWVLSERFYGCMFINASAEYPRRSDPIHVACSQHKLLVIQYIEQLISELKLENPRLVSRQMALLIDGAIVNAHTANDKNAARLAKDTAFSILTTYL